MVLSLNAFYYVSFYLRNWFKQYTPLNNNFTETNNNRVAVFIEKIMQDKFNISIFNEDLEKQIKSALLMLKDLDDNKRI